jgi:hypothetical protein
MTSPIAVPVSQPRCNSKLSDSVLICTNRDAHKFNSSEPLDKPLRHPTDFFQSLLSYLHLPNPLCSVICTAWMLISIQTPTLCSPTSPITRQMHFVLCPCMRPVSTVRRLKRGLSPRRYATRGRDRCRCCCRSLRRAVTVAHERGTASPATSNFLGRLHSQARGSGNESRGASPSIVTTSLPCMPRRL